MVLVTGAMASVIFKLGKFLNEERKLQTGVRKKIQTLTRDLESMHAALRKVAEVPPNQLDEEVKLWARDVRELSYKVDDILDTFLVRVDAHDEDPNPNKLKRAAKKIGKLFSKSKAHHQIAGMIKSINEQAQEVAERHRRYRADDIVAKPARTSTVDPRLAAMFREVSQLIGIDKSRGELMSMLSLFEEGSDGSSNEKMKIVSVVGAGGVGKTTIAKAVHDSIKPHFDCGAFVPVGQKPDIKKVLRDILIDLDKNVYINSSLEKLDERQLLNELRWFLGNKRYFVVIDDIWEPQTWETIKLALVDHNCGCRALITTRKFEVAKEAGEVYKLQPLSDDNSKRLFYTRLFGCEEKCPNNHLRELSDRILKKCGGVPLAIITMASLLLGKSRYEWIEVCNSPGFYQDKNDRHLDNTMQILSLSYYDLPPHLKTCLLYLSVFPEDSFIDKGSLIWKWIAEGFVEKKPGRGLFEVGEEYFHDLINRSMIQGVDSGDDGIMDGCRVHDMVLDLIVSISSDENFVNVDGTLEQSHARRLALKNRELDLSHDTDVNIPQVRSLLVLQCDIGNWALHPRLKLIRVLVLVGCTFREGCQGLMYISNLLHLRYLGIRGIQVKQLPEGIGKLEFLQTLELEDIGFLELPCSIGMLTQLVCLRAQDITAPDGVIGRLTSLEELQIRGPSANDQSRRQFGKDLGNLCELKVLDIAFWDMDENMQKHMLQSLDKLQKMQHLRVGNFINNVNMNAWDAAVPSRDLRCLFLPAVMFTKLPSWINYAHLPSLSHLEIVVHDLDDQGLIALGGLPELCYLSLATCSTATITSNNNSEAEGCFKKLRSFTLCASMVQFVANEDSSASFTMCSIYESQCCRRKKDSCRVVPRIVVMPNLEELRVRVEQLMQNNIRCEDIGLEYRPSIREVKVEFECPGAYEDDVEREEAALRHAIEVHPNRPALQINDSTKQYMKRRSNDDASDDDPIYEEDADSNCTRSDHDDDPAEPRTEEDEVAPVLA